jgi:hypothetical protein
MPETSRKPRIALGSEPRRLHIKETIRQSFENSGGPVKDLGTWSEEAMDHPDYGTAAGNPSPTGRTTTESRCAAAGFGIPVANRALTLEMVHCFSEYPVGRQVQNNALVGREESKKD